MTVEVGFALHPDDETLDRCRGLIGRVDYLEVAPETTWFERDDGTLVPNAFAARFRELGDRFGKTFVAHGIGLSLGDSEDGPRRARWIDRVAEDQALFDYRWYTDHGGMTSVASEAVSLPVPVPLTRASADRTRRRLRLMEQVAPIVGLETTAHYFLLGDPLDEPGWINEVVREEPSHGVLLDLHNVWTMARNLGFDPAAYIERLDLRNVIELHVSGGSDSDPRWLPEGRTMRLDGHDDAVPNPVFTLLHEVARRCPNLRGITLERMEGTVRSPADVETLERELALIRAVAEAARPEPPPTVARAALPDADPEGYEEAMVAALRSDDPVKAWSIMPVNEDGLRIAALLVAKLRFERLMRGSSVADAWFERSPRELTEAFRRYHREEAIRDFFPAAEGRRFERWLG